MAEVAGLVLGALPLLISALEHYEDCYNVLESMLDFRIDYRKARNRLRQLVAVHDSTLTLLLIDVVSDEKEMEALKAQATRADPSHGNGSVEVWSEIEKKLKDRLRPKIYPEYLQAMKDLNGATARLIQELGSEKPLFQEHWNWKETEGQLPRRSLLRRSQTKVLYEAQRVRFSFGRAKRDEMLAEIEGYNQTLETLLSQNDEIVKQLARAKHHPGHAARRGLLGFWLHARNIYESMSKCWICACRPDHRLDLRLEYRTVPDIKLEIVCRFHQGSQFAAGVPWRYHPVSVTHQKQHLLSPIPATANPQAPRSTTPPRKAARFPTPALKRSKDSEPRHHASAAKKPVSFAMDPVSAAEQRTAQPNAGTEQSLEIRDLCQSIGAHCSSKPCSGRLLSANAGINYTMSSPMDDQTMEKCLETVSLRRLLSNPDSEFDRAARYSVAVAVASSHLQLHSSAWLGSKWSGDDIIFVQTKGAPELERPFLRKGLGEGEKTADTDSTLVTLGILLMELCFGKDFERSAARRATLSVADPGMQDVLAHAAALKWAEGVQKEAGAEYAQAVDWCLTRRPVESKDDSWRLEFQQAVIEPLQACSEQLNPVAPSHVIEMNGTRA